MVSNAQVTVPAAGTAVQIDSDTSIREYYIRALPGNTGVVYLGDSNVSASNGLPLAKADGPIFYNGRLSELYVDAATNDDGIGWLEITF
jgi:hypothetical protein